MSRNASIAMLVIFLTASAVFFSIFWKMESGSGDELQKNLEKNNVATPNTSTVQSTKSAINSSNNNANNTTATPSTEQANGQESPASSSGTANSVASDANSSVAQDNTADWKAYKDTNNNFEFKYPSDASVSSDGNIIKVTQGDVFWRMRFYGDASGLDLQNWYLNYFSDKERRNCTLSDTTTIKVGTYETKYANPNFGNALCLRDGYFSIDESKKNIVRIFPDKETTDNMNKVLATFKFDKN
jgi:hypothetical protein